MASNFSFDDDFNESFMEDEEKPFITLDSIVFLVDGTEQMFENNYFTKCLEVYRNVIRQKCAFNRKDKVGLIVCGTKESNCDVDNLMALQKFDNVTIDSLKNINAILKENVDKYKNMCSGSKYSLHDALFYAYRLTDSFKTNSKKRNLIFLCTCKNKPSNDSPEECRQIEYLVATFKDSETKLWVAGLSNSWDDKLYYRDLQIISGSFNNDDYRKISLSDIEQNIISPSTSIGKLTWKISSQIAIHINLMNIVTTPIYPSKVKLQKEHNEILEDRHILCENESFISEAAAPMKENKIIADENLIYYKHVNHADIFFKPAEYKQLRNMGLEEGIQILAFKPILCDPIFHVKCPYFITCAQMSNHESKLFFEAFISRCAKKEVMPICKIVTRVSIFICAMIPSEDDGGFYAYKIPTSDKVRDFDNHLQSFIYNSENQCQLNDTAVDIFKKLMEAYKKDFDVKKFKNPKLEKCIAHIEALALDEKLDELPSDKTVLPQIANDVNDLKNELIHLLYSSEIGSTKRKANEAGKAAGKKAKLDIVALAKKNMLHKATISDLRAYLDSVNQACMGNKTDLINNIKEYLGV